MTVRELLCMCKNVNYGRTIATVYDTNGGCTFATPGNLPERVKNAHVKEYCLSPFSGPWLKRIAIWIEERNVL